jgi:hypothetical protein
VRLRRGERRTMLALKPMDRPMTGFRLFWVLKSWTSLLQQSIWEKPDITIWSLQPVFKLFSNVSVPAIFKCPG